MYRSKIEIHNLDCLSFVKECNDGQFDLILTDPPYLFNKSPGKPYSERSQYNTKSKFSKSELYDFDGFMMNEMASFTEKDLYNFLNETKRILNVYNGYYFCSEAQVPLYCKWATDNSLMFTILIWEKPLSIINKNRYSQNVEFIIRIYDYGTALSSVTENKCYNRVKKYAPPSNRIHPTQKPINLMKEILKVSEPQNVFDPFCGSGSVAVACDELGLNLVACEINEGHFERANKRIDQHRRQQTLFEGSI
jgi:site-specific DNA-methyltransferase (adenine-specific)